MSEKVKTAVTFEMQGDKSYACIVEHKFSQYGLIGYGKTAREAEADVFDSIREYREQDGIDAADIEITRRTFDVGSFFSYYPFFNVTQFAKFVGMNATQVRQYASGLRRPTAEKKEQLNRAIRHVAETFLTDSRAFGIV